MDVLTTPNRIRYAVAAARDAGRLIGLVPTMGALHAGHLSLVQTARQTCDVTVVTIFVNPAQFGPHEDFARYPRQLEADLARLQPLGVDFVFAPTNEDMYPAGCATRVDVGPVAAPLEGACRPGHFQGVATIVLKLFHLIPADIAFFGQKDYQQSLVVRRMAADLDLPIRIEICPIVRDPDGLALSSRNAYLSADERRRALGLSRSLEAARTLVAGGNRQAAAIVAEMRRVLVEAGVEAIDYVVLAHPDTLEPVADISLPTVALVAARVGQTRLIDNALLTP